MNDFFVYDSMSGSVELNGPDLLLTREFDALMDNDRNKCKEDKTGEQKLRAYRELKYIYLAIHWRSPYADYLENERHMEALRDSEITEKEFNDPVFRAACRKFKELQESNRSLRLLLAARETADKLADYFHNLDPEERDVQTGKPIFKVKEIIAEMSSINKVQESLSILEGQVKKEMSEISQLRGDAEDGLLIKLD